MSFIIYEFALKAKFSAIICSMKTLVIYGSAYGNTEKVAKLIAVALNVKARLVRDVTADKIDNLLKVKGRSADCA